MVESDLLLIGTWKVDNPASNRRISFYCFALLDIKMVNTILTILPGFPCIIVASGIGLKVFKLFRITEISELERTVFSVSLGLGITALGILILGILCFIQPIYE